MSRPIKFMVGFKDKLYEAPLIHMITSEDFTATCGMSNKFSAEEGAVLYQFTGLLDKDGKEIYEGHIVEIYYYLNGEIERTRKDTIIYRGNAFNYDSPIYREFFQGSNVKIIGHIAEEGKDD